MIARSPARKGDAGLGSAIAYFTSQGLTVSVPLTDSQDYDLLVDDGERISKVQAKATWVQKKSGAFEVWLRSNSGGCRSNNYAMSPFDWKKVDFVFILCSDGGQFCIPSDELQNNRTSVLVGAGRREDRRVS